MRTIAFTIFTPFYFIKAGLFVSLPAMWSALGVFVILLLMKLVTNNPSGLAAHQVFTCAPRGELHHAADVHRG